MDLSVVIPAYNESLRIGPTLEKVLAYLKEKHYTSEVIVVDDGSSDNTSEVVGIFVRQSDRLRLIRSDKNGGKGLAVQQGVLAASGEFIFFTDADLSTPIEELDRFFEAIQNEDIVIGSRALNGANVVKHEPFYREVLGMIFSGIVQLFFVSGFIDTQCGAKMFRKESAMKVFPMLRISRYAFDVEVLYLAQYFGCRIRELPITWFYSSNTRVRPWRDGPKMLIDILRIKWLHRDLKKR